MKSRNSEKSIFDINFLISQNNLSDSVKDIELVSQNVSRHVLSQDINTESSKAAKSDMVELIKTGYSLPEADTPENMLCGSSDKKEKTAGENTEQDTFKIINLVSANYNLPKVDDDNLLK